MRGKKCLHVAFASESGETVVAFERQKQNAAECSIYIRQSNQHERSTRPYVQRMRFHCVLPILRGGNREFLVAVIQILLREVEARCLQELRSDGGSSTVCTNHNLRFNAREFPALFIAKFDRARAKIEARAALLKMDLY